MDFENSVLATNSRAPELGALWKIQTYVYYSAPHAGAAASVATYEVPLPAHGIMVQYQC